MPKDLKEVWLKSQLFINDTYVELNGWKIDVHFRV